MSRDVLTKIEVQVCVCVSVSHPSQATAHHQHYNTIHVFLSLQPFNPPLNCILSFPLILSKVSQTLKRLKFLPLSLFSSFVLLITKSKHCYINHETYLLQTE